MGIFKTKERIMANDFWPGMDRDVKAHVAPCVDCQRTKPYWAQPRAPIMPLPQPSTPNHSVHIDLFGLIASSEAGKKYILVMTDAFSKYVELASIRSKEAEEVANALFDTWISRYSTMVCIVSDNGKEFCNKVMKCLSKKLKFVHKNTSPYHPECNASAEVFNRTMRHYIQAVIQPPYLDWELYLPALRISYNTSVSKATKFTPFEIMFGMEANMPFFDFPPSFSYDVDYSARLVALEKARRAAEENNLIYKKMYESQYNARHKTRDSSELVVGDQILVALQPSAKYKNNKLHPTYEGPFPVVRVNLPNVYYQKKNKTQVTHVNRVKKASLVSTCLKSDNFADTVVHEGRPARKESDVPKLIPRFDRSSESSSDSDDDVFLRRPVRPGSGSNDATIHGTVEDSLSLPPDASFWPNTPPRGQQSDQTAGIEMQDQASFMDTDERSHWFQDVTMRPDETASPSPGKISFSDRVKSLFQSKSAAKRGLTSPEQPSAKQVRSSSPEVQDVSLSLADLVLSSPEKLLEAVEASQARALRSRGPVSEVPNINFPVESKAYQKRLAQIPPAPSQPLAAPAEPAQDAAGSEPSTVPELGEGHAEQNAAPPRSPGEV